jgi:hypothetical protein
MNNQAEKHLCRDCEHVRVVSLVCQQCGHATKKVEHLCYAPEIGISFVTGEQLSLLCTLHREPSSPTCESFAAKAKPDFFADRSLSVRTMNVLKNEEIDTLDKLCALSAGELLRLPNFGRRSLKEIEDALVERGLRLRDE